jgi:ABC-type uncharacterized transport system permease subunit
MVAFHELVWNKDVRQNLLIKLFCSGVFLLKMGSNKELLQCCPMYLLLFLLLCTVKLSFLIIMFTIGSMVFGPQQ